MTDPAWAKGHPLDRLRELAAPFAEQFKPHIYGAFGLPKEADMATALSAGELIWTRHGGNGIQAAAMFKVLRSPSRHTDFAGREARIMAGDLFIRAIAGTDSARQRIVDRLIDDSAAPAVWIEDLVESPRAALWGQMGFERQLTKIAASSDIRGIWHCGDASGRLPGDLAAADRASLATIDERFLSAEDIEAALAEVRAFEDQAGEVWAQHYSTYNKRKSWTAIALRGFDPADPQFIIKPTEMSKAWRAENPARMAASCGDTVAMPHFPKIAEIVGRLPGRPQRIRLMRLASNGGELTRHADIVDPEAGTADRCTARIHIPLISSPACRFIGWNHDGQRAERHYPAGSLFYLDTRKPHSVINDGPVERIHIVVDQFSSPELRRMIETAGAA